jgi:hypothetical protein
MFGQKMAGRTDRTVSYGIGYWGVAASQPISSAALLTWISL